MDIQNMAIRDGMEWIAPSFSGGALKLGSLSSATLFFVLLNVMGELVLVLYFLQKRRKSCSTLLYLLLLLADLVTSTTGIFACFEIYRYQRYPNYDLERMASNISSATSDISWGWMSGIRVGNAIALGISSRFSAAAFCTLSVVRLNVIVNPFFNPNRKHGIVWLSGCIVVISASQAIPYSLRQFSCTQLIFSCMPFFHDNIFNFPTAYLNLIVFQTVPFLLPCLIVLAIAVAAAVYHLRKIVAGEITDRKVIHSCHTVLFNSTAFLCTTVPFVGASFAYYLDLEGTLGVETAYHLNKVKLFYIFLTLFLHFRSSLTILVFIARSSGFRHFLRQVRRRNVRLMSFLNPEMDRALQTTLQDQGLEERIRRHVTSNPAVKNTALSVRWDRKVHVHSIIIANEAISTRAIEKSKLSSICEDLAEE